MGGTEPDSPSSRAPSPSASPTPRQPRSKDTSVHGGKASGCGLHRWEAGRPEGGHVDLMLSGSPRPGCSVGSYTHTAEYWLSV